MTSRPSRDGKNPRLGGSPLQQLEWNLRADARLNATGRVIWMLTALSSKRPANMPMQHLVKKLGVSEWTVRKGLRLGVECKLFEKTPKGYRRTVGQHFTRRVRRCKKINLTVRLAWLLIDLLSGSKDGELTISLSALAEELNSGSDLVSVAARRLVDLGLFCRRNGRGGTYVYSATTTKFAGDGKTIDQDGNPADDIDDDTSDFGTQSNYWDYFGQKERHHGNRSPVRE